MKTVLNRKQKAWIILGVSAFFVIGFGVMAYLDFETIGEEKSKIASLKTQNAKADATIAQIKGVENRVLKERLRVNDYTEILPLDKEINDFVKFITDFEAESGVEIEVLDDKAARNRNTRKTKEAFVRITYKIEVLSTIHQFLSFMNLFETHDRFVSVKEFDIKGGDPETLDDGTELAARHKISMTLETYVYKPKNTITKPVKILNAEQRLADLAADVGESALELEMYDFKLVAKRRDPFANPRRSIEPEGQIDIKELERQRGVIAKLVEELDEILVWEKEEQKQSDVVVKFEMTRRLDESAKVFSKRLHDLTSQKTFTSSEIRLEFENKVVNPFQNFLEGRDSVASFDVPLQELDGQLEKMRAAYSAAKHVDVVQMGQTLMVNKPAKPTEEMAGRFEEIAKLIHRSEVQLEFAQIELEFAGFVLPSNDPVRSVAIINGRAYSKGDRIDEVLVVREVRPAEVVFHYRGENIIRKYEDD